MTFFQTRLRVLPFPLPFHSTNIAGRFCLQICVFVSNQALEIEQDCWLQPRYIGDVLDSLYVTNNSIVFVGRPPNSNATESENVISITSDFTLDGGSTVEFLGMDLVLGIGGRLEVAGTLRWSSDLWATGKKGGTTPCC
jgi:hypothetical protein